MSTTDTTADRLLGTAEAARLLALSPRTVERYADRGALPCRRLPSGHRRFRHADVVALADRMDEQ